MKNLTVVNKNGIFVVDSREVSEMIGKRHDHLIRDIKGYAEILENSIVPKIGVNEFFIESVYQDSIGRTLPCYLLTKKGCDMVANKMTGEKGVLFTAAYVIKFEEMENQINKPTSLEDLIIMQATSVKELKSKVLEIESTVSKTSDKTDVLEKRLNNLIDIDLTQPKKDILNKYIQRYAIEHCKSNFIEAWKTFDDAFYYATNMKIKTRAKNAGQSRPVWLETHDYLDTAIRIADNMLNK